LVSNRSDLSQNLDVLRSLRYRDYGEFHRQATAQEQEQVRSVVDFFNDIQHLIERQRLEDELGPEQVIFIEGCQRDWDEPPRPTCR
jgi:hypothetical protein